MSDQILREIIRCEVGSSAHGVNLPGTDDLDLMGIAIEYPEFNLGLEVFTHYSYRTAEIREGTAPRAKFRPRSLPGDTDLFIFSLRRFAELAAVGDPSKLLLLFAPVISSDYHGADLIHKREMFLSRQAGERFLGYLKNQKERLKGQRGGMKITRQELIDKYGFDTKYAMHAIRLGYQGWTLMKEGHIPVPVEGFLKDYLLDLRTGGVKLEQALETLEYYEAKLRNAIPQSKLPVTADYFKISKFLARTYVDVWNQNS